MKILVFDIYGKFAHFRKFYTNSSSLTYGIPPRTTITGIIAAIMGLERDSYYDEFNSDNLKIAVKKIGTTQKIIQTLNYMRATTMNELIIGKEHTQVPFEILRGKDNVRFRIYLTHRDKSIFEEIERRVKKNLFIYPPYFGSASFGCNILYVDTLKFEELRSNNYIDIGTVIRTDQVEEINLQNYRGKLIKERMTVDFSHDRNIKEVSSYIYDDDGKSIEVKIKDEIIRLSNGEYILFM